MESPTTENFHHEKQRYESLKDTQNGVRDNEGWMEKMTTTQQPTPGGQKNAS